MVINETSAIEALPANCAAIAIRPDHSAAKPGLTAVPLSVRDKVSDDPKSNESQALGVQIGPDRLISQVTEMRFPLLSSNGGFRL